MKILNGRKFLVYLLIVLTAAISACKQYEPFYTEEKWDTTVSRGQEVVDAIEKYRSKFGLIPDNLQSLIHENMIDIVQPPTVGKQEWRYQKRNIEGVYDLYACTKDGYPCIYYSSDTGTWAINE